jgi:hypothetical protein
VQNLEGLENAIGGTIFERLGEDMITVVIV